MEELSKFRADLETLQSQRSMVQVKMEEAVAQAKQLKEQLAKSGYASLAEAEAAYQRLLGDAETKHAHVKQLIEQIKTVESSIPTRDEILASLREGLHPTENPIT